ncbi:uncharacterized protein LOC111273207 [Varroa jacobsoni]|uniref:uncharacterized protein LOC111273207 n=1 Tax=Varroa jacobsoni TaxID=62625 RepID=UPI000BF7B305|nr:uncharacterized protein LOC111273207 [Varroa jacobsoni]
MGNAQQFFVAICLIITIMLTFASGDTDEITATRLGNSIVAYGVEKLVSQIKSICKTGLILDFGQLPEFCIRHLYRTYRTVQILVRPLNSNQSRIDGYVYATNISVHICYSASKFYVPMKGCFDLLIRQALFEVAVQVDNSRHTRLVKLNLFMGPPIIVEASGLPGRWILRSLIDAKYESILEQTKRNLQDIILKELFKLKTINFSFT